MNTITTITVTYKLNPSAAELLGDDALSAYEAALAAELTAKFPGAEVDVDVRLASVDESSFDARCTTTEGADVAVWTRGTGRVEVAADPDELDWAAQEAIRRDFRQADETAWEAAWEAACEGA